MSIDGHSFLKLLIAASPPAHIAHWFGQLQFSGGAWADWSWSVKSSTAGPRAQVWGYLATESPETFLNQGEDNWRTPPLTVCKGQQAAEEEVTIHDHSWPFMFPHFHFLVHCKPLTAVNYSHFAIWHHTNKNVSVMMWKHSGTPGTVSCWLPSGWENT